MAMSVDAIGDFLTIIRNGRMVSKPFVIAPYSSLKLSIAQILKNEGFIRDFIVINDDAPKKTLKVLLKYVDGESVIHEINRVSTPGCRYYSSIKHVKPVIDGLGISIISTPRGILSNKQAEKLKVGGEVLCTVW
jgi:small subunit ribosomal protein S8